MTKKDEKKIVPYNPSGKRVSKDTSKTSKKTSPKSNGVVSWTINDAGRGTSLEYKGPDKSPNTKQAMKITVKMAERMNA